MAITATVSTTAEVTLSPRQALTLRQEFKQVQKLRAQIKEAEAEIKKRVAKIAAVREETGEMSLSLDGFKTTLVASTQSKFNKKKFIAIGGDLSLYEEAVEITPKTPYELVTCPD